MESRNPKRPKYSEELTRVLEELNKKKEVCEEIKIKRVNIMIDMKTVLENIIVQLENANIEYEKSTIEYKNIIKLLKKTEIKLGKSFGVNDEKAVEDEDIVCENKSEDLEVIKNILNFKLQKITALVHQVEDTQPTNENKIKEVIENIDILERFIRLQASPEIICLDDEMQTDEIKSAEIDLQEQKITEFVHTALVHQVEETQLLNEQKIQESEVIEDMKTLERFIQLQASPDIIYLEDEIKSAEIDFQEQEITDVVHKEDEEHLRFYWYDACEDKYTKSGRVFLFGRLYNEKNKSGQSCCVTVHNIEKQVFILPRAKRFDLKTKQVTNEPVSMLDVYTEVKKKYRESDTFRFRKVVKKYCFTMENIPLESEYLEIRYPATGKEIFKPQEEAETFEYVFGTTVGPLERLILEKKLKGPCWLDLWKCEREKNPISHCHLEFRLKSMSDLKVNSEELQPAALSFMAVSMTTGYNPKNNINEIVMITIKVNPSYSYHLEMLDRKEQLTMIRLTSDDLFKSNNSILLNKNEILICKNEYNLINCFIDQLKKYDPDLIIGHDLVPYQLELLIRRCEQLNISKWSRLGRLNRSIFPRNIKNFQIDVMPGRLICDIKLTAEELVRSRSYDLPTLCKVVINVDFEADFLNSREDINEMFNSFSNIENRIFMKLVDVQHIIRITHELQIFPLAVNLTSLSGFILSKTLTGHRSERIEYLLLHAFNEYNYILPDKMRYRDDSSEKGKPGYVGGLVLEPKVGFYDTLTVLLDFNSLYPSIIREYNICFTTRTALEENGVKEAFTVLPKIMQRLVSQRAQVKEIIRKGESLNPVISLNVKEKALKHTANSVYGCLGYKYSRFYCKDLAAYIADKGRFILANAKAAVENFRLNVIYGDTDSIMVNTDFVNIDDALKMSKKIQRSINLNFTYIKLEYEGTFKYMLLLQKKKYAGLLMKRGLSSLTYDRVIKGLDIVRRDWSLIATKAGEVILNMLFEHELHSDRIENIYKYLRQTRAKLTCNKIHYTRLSIAKKLGKDPALYKDNTVPHAVAAQRMNLTGVGRKYRQGDLVTYVICDDGTSRPAVQRSYVLEEFAVSSRLKIDVDYYLNQQIYPVVTRLCSQIKNIDSEKIAQCLGIEDKQDFNRPQDNAYGSIFSHPSQYKNVMPVIFTCPDCKQENKISKPTKYVGNKILPSFYKCCNKNCTSKPVNYMDIIVNSLNSAIKNNEEKCNIYMCDTCNKISNIKKKQCECCTGALIATYSAFEMCKQLKYFLYIFNVSSYCDSLDIETKHFYTTLTALINTKLHNSTSFVIDVRTIFNDV